MSPGLTEDFNEVATIVGLLGIQVIANLITGLRSTGRNIGEKMFWLLELASSSGREFLSLFISYIHLGTFLVPKMIYFIICLYFISLWGLYQSLNRYEK